MKLVDVVGASSCPGVMVSPKRYLPLGGSSNGATLMKCPSRP